MKTEDQKDGDFVEDQAFEEPEFVSDDRFYEDPYATQDSVVESDSLERNSSTESATPLKKEIVIDLSNFKCLSISLIAGTTFFATGSVLGAVSGVGQGMAQGILRTPGFGAYVRSSALSSGKQLGLFVGVYQGTSCLISSVRQKTDMFNVFGAGFAAGVVGSIKSRSPTNIVASGLLSAVSMCAIDLFLGKH